MKKQTTTKKTILVIEDERPLLEIVDMKLKKSGFKVISARSVDQVFSANLSNGDMSVINEKNIRQALEYIDDLEHVDAIWLDHNLLGKENGLDLVKKIKANGGRWKKVPIFVVSNSDGSKTIQSYVELGVRNYYVKSNHRLDEIIGDIKKRV